MPESGLARPSHDESVQERTISPDVDFPTEESTEPEQLGWEHSEIEPIPVYQVGIPPVADVIVGFGSDRYTVTTNPVQCAGANRNRTSLSIVNHSTTNEVYIAGTPQVSSAFSGKIDAGASLDLEHNSAVWAICATGESAEISVFQEYTLDES